MDRKQIPGEGVPAIVITVVELAFYGDEGSKAGATLPTRIADEFNHTMIVRMTASQIKAQYTANAFHPERRYTSRSNTVPFNVRSRMRAW